MVKLKYFSFFFKQVAFHDTFDKYRGLLSFTLGHSEYALQLIKTISHFNGFMKYVPFDNDI